MTKKPEITETRGRPVRQDAESIREILRRPIAASGDSRERISYVQCAALGLVLEHHRGHGLTLTTPENQTSFDRPGMGPELQMDAAIPLFLQKLRGRQT